MTTLYITSASMAGYFDDLDNQPLAGNLFAVETGIKGIPEAYVNVSV